MTWSGAGPAAPALRLSGARECSLSTTTRCRADGAYCYRVTGHYCDPTPDSTSNTAPVLYDATPPAVPTSRARPTAPRSGHGADPGHRARCDSGARAQEPRRSRSSADPRRRSAAPPTAPSAEWAPDGNHTLWASRPIGRQHAKTVDDPVNVDNTPPPALSDCAQSSVPGRPTLVLVVNPARPYTFTHQRDGRGQFPEPVTSPWTDPTASRAGTAHLRRDRDRRGGNVTTSLPSTVLVTPPSATAPRSLSASSPTNAVPHLTWLPPVTFAVTSWQIFRDGVALPPITRSGDDELRRYDGRRARTAPVLVQALNNGTAGDMSSSISVTTTRLPPSLGPRDCHPEP